MSQQKWGLFETNSQRERGISTEQSLQEIEAACNGEMTVTVIKRTCGKCGHVNDKIESCVKCKASLTSKTVEQTSNIAALGKESFGPGGGAGGAFFDKVQADTKKKYAPKGNLGD